MDPRLLRYYTQELQHVREMGGEFAARYPKIAGRLGMEGIECADPYVERLLEGFAFIAARIQLKLDAQQPVFSQHLLETLYPHYLRPVPSMAVVQFLPGEEDSVPPGGHVLPRHSALHSRISADESTACRYRTAHPVTLWPLRMQAASYLASAAEIAAAGLPMPRGTSPKAALRLQLRAEAGVQLDAIAMDALSLHLAGADGKPWQLHELLLGQASGFAVRTRDGGGSWSAPEVFDRSHIEAPGYSADEALLPYDPRSFSGYRLLQEYFACPQRFLFVCMSGLRRVLARASGNELEIVVWLDRQEPRLEGNVDAESFRLHCCPVINLFERRGDRIHLDAGKSEYHVLADRSRPMDFEVYGVAAVEGFADRREPDQRFLPFYAGGTQQWHEPDGAYYTLRREQRLLSTRQKREGARSSYIGSEVFIALVDGRQAPYRDGLRQLGMQLLCTNRDLPLHMPVGRGSTDFDLDVDAPVASVRCVAGPSRPRPAPPPGETTWRLISQLQSNYLAMVDAGEEGALALREMLSLHADGLDAAAARQVRGVRQVRVAPVMRRLPVPGPIAHGRGLEVTLSCEDAAFEGGSAYLLGSVLSHVFARQVSLNAFVETVLRTDERGEVGRWGATPGVRGLL